MNSALFFAPSAAFLHGLRGSKLFTAKIAKKAQGRYEGKSLLRIEFEEMSSGISAKI